MMSNNVNFHTFETQADLIDELSQSIARQLQGAIDKNGKASLLVSGGRTPQPLFETLRQMDLAWEKVSIGLCDERWVPSSHEDSNEKLVKTYLLQAHAGKAAFVGMYHDDMPVDEAEKACTEKIKETLFPFDVVILGMGNDAHTASLFPKNVKLKKAFDIDSQELCVAMKPKNAPHMRMSLTRSAILSAKHLYLHFEGKEKLGVYQEALEGDDMYAMPIRSILHQNITEVEVYYR